MRLQLVLDEEIIRKNFDPIRRDIQTITRISQHQVIISPTLRQLWFNDARENKYDQMLELWLQTIVGQAPLSQIVKGEEMITFLNEVPQREKILISTALRTEDKIVVGRVNTKRRDEHKEVKFIKPDIFSQPKKQNITSDQVELYLRSKSLDYLFDLHETPIIIEVKPNADAAKMGEFLSKFYKDSPDIIIQDMYLNNQHSECNLNKYILPYLDNSKTNIQFWVHWDKNNIREFDKFKENYAGFNSTIRNIQSKENCHESFIRGTSYKIVFGYRLQAFGKSDGKMLADNIIITRIK